METQVHKLISLHTSLIFAETPEAFSVMPLLEFYQSTDALELSTTRTQHNFVSWRMDLSYRMAKVEREIQKERLKLTRL